MDALSFRLDSFEGPLDLLLKLITKNKVDILDIPIALILDQYMEYVEQMQTLDLDTAGEFIAMASELMLIKSRMLLPKAAGKPEDDPRADLAAALLEYKRMKEAAALIFERYKHYYGRLPKDNEDIAPDETLYDQSPALLKKAFSRIAARSREFEDEKTVTGRAIGGVINRQPASIPGKIIGIMRLLYRRPRGAELDELLCCAHSRSELVAIFMAVLELLRVRRIICEDEPAPADGDEAQIAGGKTVFTLNRERAVMEAKNK